MKIVIVGGGTSGWLAALKYADILTDVKNLDVTVIDSSKIPISGTGEGSTGIFVDFVLKQLINIKIPIKAIIICRIINYYFYI